MSFWQILEDSMRKKGYVDEEEKIPSIKDLIRRRREIDIGDIVRNIAELSEIGAYISVGCQTNTISIREGKKAIRQFIKKCEELCDKLKIEPPRYTLTNLQNIFDEWCRHPKNPANQELLVDAIDAVLKHFQKIKRSEGT